MNKHKSNKIKENSNTVRHLITGQIITTQNLVAIKEVRHAGQLRRTIPPAAVIIVRCAPLPLGRIVKVIWEALSPNEDIVYGRKDNDGNKASDLRC